MDWFKTVKGRHSKGGSEIEGEFPTAICDIFISIEDSKRAIRVNRKILESLQNPTSSFRSAENLNLSPDRPLAVMLSTQEQIAQKQRDFFTKYTIEFINHLKRWDERCEYILKLKFDFQRTANDLHKAQEKQRSSQAKDLDALKNAVRSAESLYTTQKSVLLLELFKYRTEERNTENTLRQFLSNQANFLRECEKLAKSTSKMTNPSSSPRIYFGTSLKDHIDADGYSVVLKKFLTYLVKNGGYNQEGIFRVAGQMSYAALLRDAVNAETADDHLLEFCGVYVVADVVKQYLQNLPESLITSQFVESWHAETPSPSDVYSLMQTHLPDCHRKNLIIFLQFLVKITENEASSKMSPENLTTTLHMHFYRKPSSESTDGGQHKCVVPMIQFLIRHAGQILQDQPDLAGVLGLETTDAPKSDPGVSCSSPALGTNSPKPDLAPLVPDRTYNKNTFLRGSHSEFPSKGKAPAPPAPQCMRQSSQVPLNDVVPPKPTKRPPISMKSNTPTPPLESENPLKRIPVASTEVAKPSSESVPATVEVAATIGHEQETRRETNSSLPDRGAGSVPSPVNVSKQHEILSNVPKSNGELTDCASLSGKEKLKPEGVIETDRGILDGEKNCTTETEESDSDGCTSVKLRNTPDQAGKFFRSQSMALTHSADQQTAKEQKRSSLVDPETQFGSQSTEAQQE